MQASIVIHATVEVDLEEVKLLYGKVNEDNIRDYIAGSHSTDSLPIEVYLTEIELLEEIPKPEKKVKMRRGIGSY